MRLVTVLLLLLTGCMQARVKFDDRWDTRVKPAYVDYFDGYWWGFKGKPVVSLSRVCMDQKPYGVHKVKTAEDIFLTVITLGIYTPTTVRVWCGG